MKPKLLDTTLREGEQSPRIKFSPKQRKEIVKQLDHIGIDYIELGHPGVGEVEVKRVKELTKLNISAETIAHSRARRQDIDKVAESGTQWVGIFAGVNGLSVKHKYNKKVVQVKDMIADAIGYAKQCGLNVRYTIEDATRTDIQALIEISELARDSGADRLSVADTVGIATPIKFSKMIAELKKKSRLPIHVHCHNDMGLALANSLAAYEAGCEVIDVTVNGMGERAGIVSLIEATSALSQIYGQDRWDLKGAVKLSQKVQVFTGIRMDKIRPIIGANVFTHTADLHVKAVRKNPSTYEGLSPGLFGRKRKCSCLPVKISSEKLTWKPLVEDSSKLRYHTAGPGYRSVFIDERLYPGANLYIIQREVKDLDESVKEHVNQHRHNCDSLFVFLGDEKGQKGLQTEVKIEDEIVKIESPQVMFIPEGAKHSYRFRKGSGRFINIVLSGDYNDSLINED